MQQNTKIKKRRLNAPPSLEQRAIALDAQLAYLGRVNYCALWHTRSGFAQKRQEEIDLVISEFDRALAQVVDEFAQMKTELLKLRSSAPHPENGV